MGRMMSYYVFITRFMLLRAEPFNTFALVLRKHSSEMAAWCSGQRKWKEACVVLPI